MTDRPCSADEAVARALSIVGAGGQYLLGTGSYYPLGGLDLPWTRREDGKLGSDCAGFAISWCYKLRRCRPGFNVGSWATVSNDLNCNSLIEDADHHQDLAERIFTPAPGALLLYPTFGLLTPDGTPRLNENGKPLEWIGHVKIVTGVSRCTTLDHEHPDWSLLDTAECMGPDGRRPGVVAGTGASFVAHDRVWPKPAHRTVMIRMLP